MSSFQHPCLETGSKKGLRDNFGGNPLLQRLETLPPSIVIMRSIRGRPAIGEVVQRLLGSTDCVSDTAANPYSNRNAPLDRKAVFALHGNLLS
jgi:hypothetical protein